ncbi:hypothetical protein D3C87_1114040 [compost metagenome]
MDDGAKRIDGLRVRRRARGGAGAVDQPRGLASLDAAARHLGADDAAVAAGSALSANRDGNRSQGADTVSERLPPRAAATPDGLADQACRLGSLGDDIGIVQVQHDGSARAAVAGRCANGNRMENA